MMLEQYKQALLIIQEQQHEQHLPYENIIIIDNDNIPDDIIINNNDNAGEVREEDVGVEEFRRGR